MILALTADLHGHLPEIPACDALVIAGDILPAWLPSRPAPPSITRVQMWLEHAFFPWVAALKTSVYLTWGNHDAFGMPRYQTLYDETFTKAPANLHVLVDDATTIGGRRFWFTPWTRTFFDWSFMDSEEGLATRFAAIPEDTEVLVSHGPPHGVCDLVPASMYRGHDERVGSTALMARIRQLPRLSLVICGHIHCAVGPGLIFRGESALDAIRVRNVSLVDEGYRPVHTVGVIEL